MEDIAERATARLHPVETAMARLGLGRSMVFELLGSGELRSVTVGRRRLIPESAIVEFIDRLDARAESQGADMDNAERAAVIAEENTRMARLYRRKNPAGATKVLRDSQFPAQLHAAAAIHAIARLSEQADDPEQFLGLVAEIIRRD